MAPIKAVARGSTRSGGAASSANVAGRLGSAMSIPTEGSRARNPRRAAARGKWSEEQLFTSDKSLLIDFDLVKLLAQPQAWNCLEESEKREILALLPASVHPDAETTSDDPSARIPPIPNSFIRYSNNWRDGIRQFQLDLQNGRYDPEWLHQAEDARQKREAGDFDNFKEREYERFWGQKQKAVMNAAAGEMAQVKIKTLIDEGAFRLGDIWNFEYVYGKGADRIFIHKEARILKFDGAKMTFAIPPGERVFLRDASDKAQKCATPEKAEDTTQHDNHTPTVPAASNDTFMKVITEGPLHEAPSTPKHEEVQVNTETERQTVAAPSNEKDSEMTTDFSVIIVSPDGKKESNAIKRPAPTPQSESEPSAKRKRGRPSRAPKVAPAPKPVPEVSKTEGSESTPTLPPDSSAVAVDPVTSVPEPSAFAEKPTIIEIKDERAKQLMENPDPSPAKAEASPETEQHDTDNPASSQPQDLHPTSSQATENDLDDIIVPNIMSPNGLAVKMLQIDGRMPNGRVANGWKDIRCIRNNQDIGSLFDVREAWFVRNGQK
ncbi:hypothetical protein PENANT_c008G09173 [Penicillium antarcticum]|uniref:DEUBAD domain-containing protein n=1 Tax=Penicillium antarcticum TaxID=416450 RepID=A0A1V6QAI7_9EURO|nr:uncharacterized protein N7508_007123 [Penicillium antarcticum]KAJ5302260.1 hypothetical protein N7508_007123 [Penicillium antarcticum]OQD86233.1 hypothetical protein PENANT_c008G09173 [Penicillium antarcticum]